MAEYKIVPTPGEDLVERVAKAIAAEDGLTDWDDLPSYNDHFCEMMNHGDFRRLAKAAIAEIGRKA